jgi:hypothetical protein
VEKNYLAGNTSEVASPMYPGDSGGSSNNGQIETGYEIQTGGADQGTFYHEKWGLFMFDLDEIKGKPIAYANLVLTKINQPDPKWPNTGGLFNCVRALGVSNAPAFVVGFKQSGVNYTKLVAPFPPILSGDLMYDVTDVVKAWSQGQVNTGFVFDGRDPIWPEPLNSHVVCMNYFGNFRLNVTYYPNP